MSRKADKHEASKTSAKPPKAAKTPKASKPPKPAKSAAGPSIDPATQHCTRLKGPGHRIGPDDAKARIGNLRDWKLVDDGTAIEKSYTFKNYYRTLAFVNALAFIAHAEDHHPDLGVHYGKVVVRYSTHDVGGLSVNDFICAAKAELLDAKVA